MLARRSFHECAIELESESLIFKTILLDSGLEDPKKNNILRSASQNGIELLNILALSIRRGLDYGDTQIDKYKFVGGFLEIIKMEDADAFKKDYQGPYNNHIDLTPIHLRQALNKIAHFDQSKSTYYVDDNCHELILMGTQRNENWLAVISIKLMCAAIKDLPDIVISS